MSLTQYGQSVKVYDFTFTTDVSGNATQALNIDGSVVRMHVVMDDSAKWVQYTYWNDENDDPIPGCFPPVCYHNRHGFALFGNVTLRLEGSASASGRCRVYVR